MYTSTTFRHRINIEFPDLLNNGGAGNGLAFVAHQEFKQSEFLWAEIDVVISAPHGVADAVDFRSSIWRIARAGRPPLRSTARMRAASSAKAKGFAT